MKTIIGGLFNKNSLTFLENDYWLINQRVAGKILRNTLDMLANLVKLKTELSTLDLNNIAEEFIVKSGGTCTFKGYKGYPYGVCISINNIITHGFASDYKLQDGDKVSFDIGVTYNEAIADAAITCIYGENKALEKIVQITDECLEKAIESVKVGERIGIIGNTIFKHAKSNGFNVLEDYGGHGICKGKAHAPPFISNKSEISQGIRIQPGMVLAIEPLLVSGNNHTKVLDDGWSVQTNSIGAHAEKTIYVHDNYVEVIT